jgi:hypothetical protein
MILGRARIAYSIPSPYVLFLTCAFSLENVRELPAFVRPHIMSILLHSFSEIVGPREHRRQIIHDIVYY